MVPSNSASPRSEARSVNDNVVEVYAALSRLGPSSRVNLAQEVGLSQASVGRIVDLLLRANLVREGDRVTAGTGRPQTLLVQNPTAACVAGVSVRSRSVRVHLADLHGEVLARLHRDRTDESALALAQQVASLVVEACAHAPGDAPLAAVTVGISAVWNAAAREVQAAPNLRLLEGRDLQALLQESFATSGEAPALEVDNDINLAARGERAHGAAHGVDDFFYLNLGSGVGGAAVVQGRVQRGAEGFGGEVGYLPVCRDGDVHPLEELVGREALLARAQRLGLSSRDDDLYTVLAADEAHEGTLTDFVGQALGQALVAVVTTLNPRLIVLGGAIGRRGPDWSSRIRATLARFVPLVPEVAPTELGADASLLGAIDDARHAAHLVLLQEIR